MFQPSVAIANSRLDMLFDPKRKETLEPAEHALEGAAAPSAELFSQIMAGTGTPIPVLARTAAFDKLMQLIDAGAWTDAAMALLALELPQWKLRRLVFDDGEWLCCLSQQ